MGQNLVSTVNLCFLLKIFVGDGGAPAREAMNEKGEDEKFYAHWGIFVFTHWGISVLNFLILNGLYEEDCRLQIAGPKSCCISSMALSHLGKNIDCYNYVLIEEASANNPALYQKRTCSVNEELCITVSIIVRVQYCQFRTIQIVHVDWWIFVLPKMLDTRRTNLRVSISWLVQK